MEGVWFTEGVWMLANYGELDLEQKNGALQRQEMESQLPILQQAETALPGFQESKVAYGHVCPRMRAYCS